MTGAAARSSSETAVARRRDRTRRGAEEAVVAEARELANRAFREIGAAAGGIGGVHLAVANRVFTLVGPTAAPVRVAHDAISRAVYTGVRTGFHAAGRAAGVGAARVAPAASRPPSATPRGAALLAAINGLIGDELEREGSALQEPMAIRVAGEVVEPPRLGEAFPNAQPRLVVFLHGLMETEFAWSLGGREPYGTRLERDLDCTALYVRYNTGRRISENGRSLAGLLGDVVAHWPVPVTEIALVGHSMGGLVARSACHLASLAAAGAGVDADAPSADAPAASITGDAASAAWVTRVTHVVSLGSPHLGAPLEQAVHYASAALHALPETQPVGRFLRRRSGGIRDLRHGSLVDEDWRDRDPDALRAAACAEVPLLDGATHCFVAATVTRSPKHPLGRMIGDMLVLSPSASGRSRTRRIGFRDEDGFHLGGANHFALLNHPKVYAQLHDWLGRPRALPPARG